MLSVLLALIPAPWLAALKAVPWRLVGYVLAAAAVAILVWRILVWHDFYRTGRKAIATAEASLEAEQHCDEGTACAKRLDKLQKDGEAAVETARQAAQEAARAQQAKLDAEHAREAERLKAAASVSAAHESAWRRKYAAALAVEGGACERWSKEPVPCPVH